MLGCCEGLLHVHSEGEMIIGAIVGDVIGSPYECDNANDDSLPLFCDRSRPTDDSIMTLAVAWAVLRSADGSATLQQATIECMHALGRVYPKAGYGGRFTEWLRTPLANCSPYGSWGNGSAMRVSPVAWAFDSLELVERAAAQTAEVTHNHPSAITGAQAIAGAVFLARNGASKKETWEYVSTRYGYDLDFTIEIIRESYEFAGSVPVAIVAYLEGSSFEDVVRRAVYVGGILTPSSLWQLPSPRPLSGFPATSKRSAGHCSTKG